MQNAYVASFSTFILLSLVLTLPSVFADTWYVGKGLKQGDFLKYNVCYADYHNCTPLEIGFWVQNQSSTSHDYFLQMFVIDGNTIQKGTVITTDTLQPVYSDPNISNYSSVYKNTIIWLDVFTTKNNPVNFSSSQWNPLGVHSSPPYLLSMKQEQVTVQAGTYNAWIIGWHKGVDNKIWVVPNMPFPVKAETWVDSMSGKPPSLFTFELLETGNSKTEPTWNLSQIPPQQQTSAQENGTTVYFMKPDSPTKLYLSMTFLPNWSVKIYPFIYKYPEIDNLSGNQSFSIISTPNSVQNTQQSSYNVTYTISAKSNIAGTFELFTGGCTTSSFIPLIIGLNESQVNPQIYRNFHSGWVSLSCPPNSALFKEIKITSYSGLIPKIASENSNTWINPTQSSTIPEFPSPLKQFKTGITWNNIKCVSGLELIVKTGNNSPACVRPQTSEKLMDRGWGCVAISISNPFGRAKSEINHYQLHCAQSKSNGLQH